jgi:hypothetical protein
MVREEKSALGWLLVAILFPIPIMGLDPEPASFGTHVVFIALTMKRTSVIRA